MNTMHIRRKTPHANKKARARALVAVIAAALLLAAGCAEYQEPELPPLSASEISAARLWERMTQETDFRRYDYWPEHDGLRLGQSPHGAFHRIFVNDALLSSIPVGDGRAPAGTIIVKDNYDIDERPGNLTVMAKVPGYDPENGDWFWAVYSQDGEVIAEGSLMGCITCHAGAASNDFVIVGNLRGSGASGP